MSRIETIFSNLLVLFNLQLSTLPLPGNNPRRLEIINQNKQLVKDLLRFIETIENTTVLKLLIQTERDLAKSAALVQILAEANQELADVEIFRDLCVPATMAHKNMTLLLSACEKHKHEKIAERFSKMRKQALDLLARIEKM